MLIIEVWINFVFIKVSNNYATILQKKKTRINYCTEKLET